MDNLEGRTAVVTGAASGIGRATATHLAECGMRVVLSDIEKEPLTEAAEALKRKGRDVLAVRTDVSNWDSVQELAARTLAAFGSVHVVHNNAGVVTAGPIAELSLEDWKWVLDVDLWSVIYGVKAFLPLLREAGEGHIVNTASTNGLVSAATIGPYNVAKFGVVALTETLQRELIAEQSPVRASVLCPGVVKTRIVESARNRPAENAAAHHRSSEEEKFFKFSGSMIAEGMDPAEVARMVETAIREQQFWILTHPGWHDVLRARVEALAKDGSLAGGFGG